MKRCKIKPGPGVVILATNGVVILALIGADKVTGEKVEGPKVTVKMAKDLGWWDKNGSYWPRMTEMMLKYRAAAYFARAECPEVLMGASVDYEVDSGDSAEEEPRNA